MANLFLLNRWTSELRLIQTGKRCKLDSADDDQIQITFSGEDSEIEIAINDSIQIRSDETSIILPMVVDADGCCSVRLSHVGGAMIGRYKFEVPQRTQLDEAMQVALAFFADQAQGLDPSLSLEQLLNLPFFSPGTIRNSLTDQNSLKLDQAIAEALPSLLRVCSKPRRTLTVERRIMPIDRARRIPLDAIEHLASRPELWQSHTATRITPARILSEVPEETLDLYENRVVATLIRRILSWLEKRLREVDRAFYQTETLHENLFTEYQYNRFREQRLRALWQNIDAIDYLQQYEQSKVLKDKITTLYADISSCLDSTLYKNLFSKPDVVSPLRPTNILQMDGDYRRLRQLWEMLDRLLSSQDSSQVKHQRHVQSDYANYIHGCVLLALQWIGFNSPEVKPENFPDALDFSKSLQWEGWTAVVQPPHQDNFNINIELIWESINGNHRKYSHPNQIRLVVIPVARSLFGNQDEVQKTLDTLYTSGKAQAGQASNHQNRKNHQLQTFVMLVHPTDPRDRQMSADIAPELIQRMLNIGENFMLPDDYQSFVDHNGSVGRIGMMPASPLDLSTLERFQRLFRFHTLGVDLLDGIHPSYCPVCNHDLSAVRGKFSENEAKCPKCEAKWSWRICHSCDEKIPKLEPLKMKQPIEIKRTSSHAIHAMAREQLLGRDQLAALCESDEVPDSGRIREICPHCGACTGKDGTRQKCKRCSNGLFIKSC